jgi:hypothetical protein
MDWHRRPISAALLPKPIRLSVAAPAGFDLPQEEHCEKLVAQATVRSMRRLPKRSARLAQW